MLLSQQSIKEVFDVVKPPQEISPLSGAAGINLVLTNVIGLIYSAAAITFVFMFLYSAFQMITSQGDKEAVAKARGRITWAIVGVVLLALAFVVFRILETVTGFKFVLPGGGGNF